jgi:hypothetical protein
VYADTSCEFLKFKVSTLKNDGISIELHGVASSLGKKLKQQEHQMENVVGYFYILANNVFTLI